jgi:hypothetical protein
MPLEDGGNKNMSRPKTFPYAMTLRLSSEMETALEDLAYSRRLSRAGTIRQILRRAIADAYDHGTPSRSFQTQGGAL